MRYAVVLETGCSGPYTRVGPWWFSDYVAAWKKAGELRRANQQIFIVASDETPPEDWQLNPFVPIR